MDTIEQVNEPNCISTTYRETFVPYTCQEDIRKQYTPRHQIPILRPCEGCSLHTPYHRDLRPKCVMVTSTHSLQKFSIHGKKFHPKTNIANLPKFSVFPVLHLFTLRTTAYIRTSRNNKPYLSEVNCSNTEIPQEQDIPNSTKDIKTYFIGHPDTIELLTTRFV